MVKKILLIIIDGLADRPIKALGGKTPLEAAETPNMDKLAKRGMTGLMHTVDVGVRPGSDVAHLAIFGYDPNVYYTGRGPFEAAGVGMRLEKGDVALRGNFATVDDDFKVLNRRAGRIDNTQELVAAVNGLMFDKVKILVRQGTGHRVAVVLRGKNLSGKISNSDPKKTAVKMLEVRPLEDSAAAKKTARVVNAFIKKSHRILAKHPFNRERKEQGLLPANIILLRGAGEMGEFPSFEKRYGLKAVCIAAAGMYKGVGRILGMKVLSVKGATGKPDTDVAAKIREAIAAVKQSDFVFVHIKAADNLSEDGDYMAKKAFIEKIDKSFYPLLQLKDTLVVITADHTTSSALKMHTADPVPVLIAGDGVRRDEVASFGERSVVHGKLGHIQGRHLMPILLDQIGRLPIFGA